MEHSSSTSTPQIFNLSSSPVGSVLLDALSAQRQQQQPTAFAALSSLLSPPTLSHASMSAMASTRLRTNPSLSPDPPAAGPTVASMPATSRLRSALTAAVAQRAAEQAAAAHQQAAGRRPTRTRRLPGAPQPGLHAAAAAAVAAATVPSAVAAASAPRRSGRRKRAPAAVAVAAATREDPPAKKQKRGNLKSPPPGSDDSKKPAEKTETTASCCICMDEPKPADLAKITGCDHFFCFECIEKWAERENSCPLCKVRFTKIERVNKAKKKKGEASKNSKKVKQKDQRSDIATGAALEGLLASFASSASFPHQRVARLIFSGIGATGSSPFAMIPSAARRAAAAGSTSLEDSLFSSDTDDDEDEASSYMPGGASFADFFRSVPRGPGIIVSTGFGGRHGISMTLDPPTGRSYASNSGDRNAGRQANPLEIEDDSDDEEDVEVVQVTRPV